ncbi:MAG: TatD family hydrolase [Candidatus Moranbacteria bacterium]|nr:TatD family hydrolase [Candidatus Moranbacteria bacterium]
MLDIHAHLFWKSYDTDRDVVIERARAAGVTKMICVGTEPEDNPLAIKMAEKYEGVFAAVGIHPHFFNKNIFLCHSREGGNPGNKENSGSRVKPGMTVLEGLVNDLKKLAKHARVVAIGECGLDYYSHDKTKVITDEQKALQKEGFLAQIEIAQELGLPLIVHTRPSVGSMDAYADVLKILRDTKYMIHNTVLHCYQGDTEITKKFLELENVYFSFAGNITYPVKGSFVGTKNDATETVKLVLLERLFVETDCPFLAPQSKRGQRNEPAFVMETAEKIASLKGVSVGELNQRVIENSERVFRENC